MNTEKINDGIQQSNNVEYSTASKPKTQSGQVNSANKMQKVDKIRLWSGIGFITLVVIFIFASVIVPRIIEPCSIFSSYSHVALCGGAYNFFLMISFFLGFPLSIIGFEFVLRSISNWRKIKHPTLITLIIIILNILFFSILLGILIK